MDRFIPPERRETAIRDALALLADWFGTDSFRVRDLDDGRVEELCQAAWLQHFDSRIGNRSKIGRWLIFASGRDHEVHGKTGQVVVLEQADGSKPGLYQIQLR